ncbi:MAG: 23S rRNA (guanosine(2251)-2'-O)-methyltransferase RlmB [Rhizobiales bacterium]|nr:23S rRNA (guanosine(2251)-2'-O)-methyltransferase RlmB [Hyphomicrobiales bacterium]
MQNKNFRKPNNRKSFHKKDKPPSDKHYLYGLHSVAAALNNPDRKLKELLITPNAYNRLVEEFKKADLASEFGLSRLEKLKAEGKVIESKPKQIDYLLGQDIVHQGVMLKTTPLPEHNVNQLMKQVKADPDISRPIVILDQITDPHNVGAILRTATAFNARAIITTRRHSPTESGLLAKIASGGLEETPIIAVGNLSSAINELQDSGIICIGLDSEAKHDFPALLAEKYVNTSPKAIVLGAEGKGLRQKTIETCNETVRLDMPGKIKSLNVSNAAAIALYALTQ